MAVDVLIEFLNYTFYAAHEKEAIAQNFLQISYSKKLINGSATRRKCNMKRVQPNKAAQKCCNTEKSNMERVQNESSAQ